MISIDDDSPTDPSSSHHQKQQKSHDLKVSDIDLKSTVAHLDDSNNSLPNFSIRDYVFSLRNKDISCNWPFTSTSLQLCLKHGVKNLLPPFQSLDSLRNNSSLGRHNPENCLTSQELESSFDGKPTSDQSRSIKEIVSKNSSGSKQDKESQFILQRHPGQTKSKDKSPAAFHKPENVSVNTTMTSKVCPVCKIFSSSSNTTLNAHIDQCLTGKGTMKWSESPKVVVKHKVKPRKMRLMLDIYKTASHCTVEELDRRNGTSWATNSSFPAEECQFQGEEEAEKEEPRLTKVDPVVADNEGDVYIDTNGTKVRILSVPKTGSSENHGGRKSLIMGKKKNSLYKKKPHKKYLKLSQNAGKLCLPKPRARSHKEDVVAEICNKDEQSRENIRVVDLGIIRPPWACSKRTGVSKKLNGEVRKVDLRSHQMKDSVVENHDKPFAGCDLASSRSGSKVRTSLSLTKQPINLTADSRNEYTREDYDEDIDNDDESSQSQHSDDDDDDDIGSKGSKFSSLSKTAPFPAVKFCFKRKFSAVDESRVKFVDGPSQDSSKEECRTEAYVSTKKKQERKSMTSKSTSKEESLMEIQTANEQESVRNETSSSIPAVSFTGLSTSFDPEFPTNECFELYQDQLCSTNRTLNDADKQNYFQEDDPIPIPGPPGSFLPASPGGETVSEVQIQATMDQDSMSNSPVSTVSNSRSSCGKDETYKKPFINGDAGFTESGQTQERFKNDQPCCCWRKEAALNYKDMYISRKQLVESNACTPSSLNYGSEMCSVSKYPNSSAAVNPSKPILRLMGKNLTVVKTDEDEFRPPRSSQHPQLPANFSQYQNDFEAHAPRSDVDLGPARSHYVHNGLDSQSVDGRNVYSGAVSSRPVKEEIIILHDSPVNVNEDDNTMQNRFSKGSYGQINRLYTMHPSNGDGDGDGDGDGGSLVFRGGSFQTSSAANRDAAGKWNIGSSTTYYP